MHEKKKIIKEALRIAIDRARNSDQQNKNRVMHLANLFLICNMEADYKSLIFI